MEDLGLFTAGLGLPDPWYVSSAELKPNADGGHDLHIEIDHRQGVRFAYEGTMYPVYDHQYRVWRHLRFFQYDCYLHARVPRIKTKEGQVKLVDVPWAEKGSSFSLLFEKNVIDLVSGGMGVSSTGTHYGVDSRVIFRIISRHTSIALATQNLEDVKELSVDETSKKKGHNYLTIMCDRQAKKVVGIGVGKDKEAYYNALIGMEIRGADKTKVRTITMDMSRSYIAATEELLPDADIVFDRFHLSKQLNEAVDKIRRKEQRECKEGLKNSRYLWLRHPSKLRPDQYELVGHLAEAYPTIGTAYRLKELFREIFDLAEKSARVRPLLQWMKEAWATGLEPIQDFVKTLSNHWYGIKSYFKKLVNNAFAERVNLKIQEIKRSARGYRNDHNFIMMIYFHLGGLRFGIH